MQALRPISVVLLLAAVSGASLSFSQAVNGTLLGTVTDASGASVPDARVTATELSTRVARNTVTGVNGYYAFADLTPGTYDVSVEATGFKKSVRSGVPVEVNSTRRVDVALQPGEVSESVTVSAETSLLETDRSDTGRKFEFKQLADLPIGGNRNFQTLLAAVPGATAPFRPHSPFFNSQDSLSTQVNGQTRLLNNTQLEGVDNNQRTGLLVVLIPPIEALQNVDVSTSNYEAELGRAGGAVVNAMFKSGTNAFHGGMYEFNRVSALAARNFFIAKKPVTTYNYTGGNIGGPILKNRTFFFTDYLHIEDHRGLGNRFTLPTDAFRAGDLSASPTIIYDPNSGNPDGSNRVPYAGNQIPKEKISPLSQKVLSLIPSPNIPGAGTSTNFDRNSALLKSSDNYDVKIDHNQTDDDRISVRYSYFRPVVSVPPIFGLAGGPLDPGGGAGFEGTGTNVTQSWAINYNHIFSPTLILEARFGLTHYRNEAHQADYGTNASEQFGVKGINLDPWTSGLFAVDISGFNAANSPLVGYSASLPWIRAETNFNWINTWTKTLGSHTIKWGADIRRIRDDLLQTQTFNPRGVFRYRENTTGCRGCADTRTGFGNSFASFLLDLPTQIGRDLAVAFPAWRQSQFFFFGQDKWQVTPNLTMDLGLRWEYYRPATPRFPGGFSNYNPDNNTLELAGLGNIPSNMGFQSNKKNFAPRFGLSYRLKEKTVVRAGFGISYVPFQDNTWAYNFPVKQNNEFNNNANTFFPATLPDGRIANLASGFPPPQVVSLPSSGIISPAPLNQAFDIVNLHFREAYVESWNIAVQRSLPNHFSFEAAYVGNHGVRIPIRYNLNAGLVLGAGSRGQPLFGKFGRTANAIVNFVGQSTNYNSLQTKLDRRFAGGLIVAASYTYSKAIGFVDESGEYAYYINPQRSRARQSFDRTHVFGGYAVYELPFGKNKAHLQSGLAAAVAGGWEITTGLTLRSGAPLNFTASGTTLNAPGNSNSPNINGPLNVLHGIDNALWFGTSSFSAPLQGQFGNVGRYIASGPGQFDLSGSIIRRFSITERWKLELRGEGFSLTNTPIFSNPITDFTSPNFGHVKSTDSNTSGGARVIQLGVKVLF
jgi:hypothetical protein